MEISAKLLGVGIQLEIFQILELKPIFLTFLFRYPSEGCTWSTFLKIDGLIAEWLLSADRLVTNCHAPQPSQSYPTGKDSGKQ